MEAREFINNSGIVDECYAVIREDCDKTALSVDILSDNDPSRSLLALPDYIRECSRQSGATGYGDNLGIDDRLGP